MAAGAVVALAVALSFLLVAEPASAAGPLDPPTPTDALPITSLPTCASINIASGLAANSAELGWQPSTATFMVNQGTYAFTNTPTIPCMTTSTTMAYDLYYHAITSGVPAGQAHGTWNLTTTCYFPATGVTTTLTGVALSNASGGSPTVDSLGQIPGAPTTNTTNCPSIVSIHLTAGSTVAADHANTVDTLWKPRNWTSSSSGWTPPTSVSQVAGAGVEIPIFCPINTSGTDIVTVWNNFFGSLATLPACLIVPAGWDRAGKIALTWSGGAMGQITSSIQAALPSGFVCGAVATIPVFTTTVALNTCPVDVAPDWVKTTVGYLMVLALCILVVR
ncbi:MAG TPA: hypothetical protein VHZ81_05695, partial [Galbitalea sp.]|nr:hypothetical protein [Galbitalea sp.]